MPPGPVAVTMAVNMPETEGVPVIAPVLVLMLSPVGKPVAAKLVGALLAVTLKLNACPPVPVVEFALVITGAGGVATLSVMMAAAEVAQGPTACTLNVCEAA